jgi:hypothetical protein
MTDLHRPIRVLRVSRAAFLMAAVLGVLFANVLAAYSLAAAFAMAVPIAILLTFAAVQTSTIRRWKAEARELNRPRMTPDDYQRLREMEIELGWEPSEPPAPEAELPAESPQAACDCGKCGEYARHFGHPCEQVIASQGIPPAMAPAAMLALGGAGTLSAPMTGPGGRWRPLGELPVAGGFTLNDILLMRSGAIFGTDATVILPSGKRMTGTEIRQWIEQDQAQRWLDKERRGRDEH